MSERKIISRSYAKLAKVFSSSYVHLQAAIITERLSDVALMQTSRLICVQLKQ
jgi:hypothetical protein